MRLNVEQATTVPFTQPANTWRASDVMLRPIPAALMGSMSAQEREDEMERSDSDLRVYSLLLLV